MPVNPELIPEPGRIFLGDVPGLHGPKLLTVKSVRKRKDGSIASCVLMEAGENIQAEYTMRVPASGELSPGFRRVRIDELHALRRVEGLTIPGGDLATLVAENEEASRIVAEVHHVASTRRVV